MKGGGAATAKRIVIIERGNNMDWKLWLLAGLKSALNYVIATILTVLLGVVTYSLGYHPSGEAAILVWQVVTGILVAVQRWLMNFLKHKDDVPVPAK